MYRLQRRSRRLTRQRRQPHAAWPCNAPAWHQSPVTLPQVCHAAHSLYFTARASGITFFCSVCLWPGLLFHTASCARKPQLQPQNMWPHWPKCRECCGQDMGDMLQSCKMPTCRVKQNMQSQYLQKLTLIFACAEAAVQGAKTVQIQQQVAQLEAYLQDASAEQKAASDHLNSCKTQLSHCKR